MVSDNAIVRQVSSRKHKITDTHIQRLVMRANKPEASERDVMYSLQAILRRAK
jgi:hypothetical protein